MERKILISEYSDGTFCAIVDREESQAEIRYCVEPNNEIALAISDLKLFADFVADVVREEATR